MKLTDPIPDSAVNRLIARLFIVAFALMALGGVLRLLGSDADSKFFLAGVGFSVAAVMISRYIEPDSARDDRAIAYNRELAESGSDLPPKHVGTHRWAYIALALVVFVGFPLMLLADKLSP